MVQSGRIWQSPLIVGASGQLGAELTHALRETGSANVLLSARTPRRGWLELDLAALQTAADAAAILHSAQPDLILCVGAMTFVDGCEEHPRQAFLVNAHGPSALASYAQGHGIPFVYISSDYVFDGSPEHPGPYTESSPPRPLNVYGQSKLQGERAVLRVHPEALVVRTSWVYGPDAAGKNFVSSLHRQLRQGQRVRVPSDQVSTPTFNRDLARGILALLAARAKGIVHLAGQDCLSRLELAKAIARFFALDESLIDGVQTSALGQRARRPLQSGLHSERLHALLPAFRMHDLQQGLEQTRILSGD